MDKGAPGGKSFLIAVCRKHGNPRKGGGVGSTQRYEELGQKKNLRGKIKGTASWASGARLAHLVERKRKEISSRKRERIKKVEREKK